MSMPSSISPTFLRWPQRWWRDPSAVSPQGQITGFDATPATRNGVAALVYVRMTAEKAAIWRGTPGVTILAEAPYGPQSADQIYDSIAASPTAKQLYDEVYSAADDQPERFGQMG